MGTARSPWSWLPGPGPEQEEPGQQEEDGDPDVHAGQGVTHAVTTTTTGEVRDGSSPPEGPLDARYPSRVVKRWHDRVDPQRSPTPAAELPATGQARVLCFGRVPHSAAERTRTDSVPLMVNQRRNEACIG